MSTQRCVSMRNGYRCEQPADHQGDHHCGGLGWMVSDPHGPGETARSYKAVQDVASFTAGMARLAQLFVAHPELQWLQATTNPTGHIDIVVSAGTGVLHNWVHALPDARREKGLFSIHSGAAFEEVLRDGPLTVHVRPKAGA